ncbi:MAG: hypothetical protein IPK68_00790 [Bdellovibrionales bacterium]|nr:hypothetical protein [Bdellovibrionales bacterium]
MNYVSPLARSGLFVMLAALTATGCGNSDRKMHRSKSTLPAAVLDSKPVQEKAQDEVIPQAVASAQILSESPSTFEIEISLPLSKELQTLLNQGTTVLYKGTLSQNNEDEGYQAADLSSPSNENEKVSVKTLGSKHQALVVVKYPKETSELKSGTAQVFLRDKDESNQYLNTYKLIWTKEQTDLDHIVTLIEGETEQYDGDDNKKQQS